MSRELPGTELAQISEAATRYGIDADALRALRLTEMGGPGREFGVLSQPAPDYAAQVDIAAQSFRAAEGRYREATGQEPRDPSGRYTQDFLRHFSARYAPLGAANDPTNLNANHAPNLIRHYGGAPTAAAGAPAGMLVIRRKGEDDGERWRAPMGSKIPDGFVLVSDDRGPRDPREPQLKAQTWGNELASRAMTGLMKPYQLVTGKLPPENMADRAMLTGALLTGYGAAGGLGARALPAAPQLGAALGRMGAAGAEGAVVASNQDRSAFWSSMVNLAITGLVEGVLGGSSALLKAAGGPARAAAARQASVATHNANQAAAQTAAQDAPRRALAFIAHRLPPGPWYTVPSLSANQLTLAQALRGTAAAPPQVRKIAQQELAQNFNRLDMQLGRTGVGPGAGTIYSDALKEAGQKFPRQAMPADANWFSRWSNKAAPAVGSSALKTVADTALTEPTNEQGVPAGVAVGVHGTEAMKHIPTTLQYWLRRAFLPVP